MLRILYSQPNDWADWAEFFVDTQMWPGGVKDRKTFFQILKSLQPNVVVLRYFKL